MPQQGIFVTFEGVEGAGKTTQARCLAASLDPSVVLTREPGGTQLSEQIRDLFLAADSITPMTELLLIAAARAQHVDERIRPALEKGKIVICDRFIDATVAYQGYRGGIDLAVIHQLNRVATGGLIPDLTFVLDLLPETGLQRHKHGAARPDRLEKEPLEFHRKVREGYLFAAESDPDRVKVINAAQPPNAVHADILSVYQKHLQNR